MISVFKKIIRFAEKERTNIRKSIIAGFMNAVFNALQFAAIYYVLVKIFDTTNGKTIETKDIAVMTLDLTEGLMDLGENGQSFEDKYAGKSYFPYVTPYSQSNTGFTPAPEVNDRVALYFPNGNETHAIVLGAVNNDGNGRFTNPDKRNFTLGIVKVGRIMGNRCIILL